MLVFCKGHQKPVLCPVNPCSFQTPVNQTPVHLIGNEHPVRHFRRMNAVCVFFLSHTLTPFLSFAAGVGTAAAKKQYLAF
jgi:hypothetical protein